MTQDDQLSAAVAANTQAVKDLTAAVDSEIADVQKLLDLLAQGPQPSPAVAQAIADVEASTAELQGLTAKASADDTNMPTP